MTKKATSTKKATKPKLLSSGNPQIPKGDGRAPVQAYLDAMPGWQHDLGVRLDEIICREVPDVANAVKWNTPLYGVPGDGWFLSLYTYTNKVQVTWFRGTSLDPVPPGESKTPDTRYLDVREDEELDGDQFTAWVQQASRLPGEHL